MWTAILKYFIGVLAILLFSIVMIQWVLPVLFYVLLSVL